MFYRGLEAFYVALGHVNHIGNYYYYYYITAEQKKLCLYNYTNNSFPIRYTNFKIN